MEVNPQLTFGTHISAEAEKIGIAFAQLKVLADIKTVLSKDRTAKATEYHQSILLLAKSKSEEVFGKLKRLEDGMRADIKLT